jgi:purine-nucleoside phosphorylase
MSAADSKLLKKAKNFFDDKQKPKIRIASLYSILEFPDAETSRFFKEHDLSIITVLMEYFQIRCDKIKSNFHK